MGPGPGGRNRPVAGIRPQADALLTQREVCRQIAGGGGECLLPVKGNQPTLRQDAADAFPPLETGGTAGGTEGPAVSGWLRREWQRGGARLPVAVDAPVRQRRGRWERRELRVLSGPELNRYAGSSGVAGEAWAHLQQACRPERLRRVKGREQVKVSYGVTGIPAGDAGAGRLLKFSRGHWGMENRLHWVRDDTFGEDRSQLRTGAAPQVMAALRNLVIALVRRAGHSNVAAALRRHAARLPEALALLSIAFDAQQ